MATAEKDTNAIIHDEILKKKKYIQGIQNLWARCDVDETGYISLEDFQRLVGDPEFDAFTAT
eukprot:CAMPEP_0180658758 /NCGR_PEP_ID=MMETSP1037_2-20121125/57186_1 /TAXON_ID=632150 /ORGANISM="Azadinium spinosum, Strain 3D9" /LENGTH=61 /DNA_ID=CAMNT_0022685689 /DNA_START=184 /DNA_END=365 /DNA_ORIENTATION=-